MRLDFLARVGQNRSNEREDEMTHSDNSLILLLRQGWRGDTGEALMREAADRIEALNVKTLDEFDTGCTEDCGDDCWVDHRGEQ